MTVLHICGDRAIYLLFCDHQDTESEAREMEIGADEPILTEKIHPSIYGIKISIFYKIGENICVNSSYLWSFSHFPTII